MIVVDRIEGTIAVLEVEGKTYELPTSVLPEGAGEGSVLRLSLDEAAAGDVLAQSRARLERLKARNPGSGGTFSL